MQDLTKVLQQDIIYNYKKESIKSKTESVPIYSNSITFIEIVNGDKKFLPGDGYNTSQGFSSFIWNRYKNFNINE